MRLFLNSLLISLISVLVIFLAYLYFFHPAVYVDVFDFIENKSEFVKNTETKEVTVIESHARVQFPGDSPITKVSQTLPDNAQLIPMEKVNNVGYTFYLGIIDNPNNSVINDDFKNQITSIISNAHFPQFLLNNLSIVMVNSLAATPLMYVETPSGWVQLDNFTPNFLNEAGVFSNYYGTTYLIFLNKQNVSDPFSLKGTLTHELGHYVETQMTTADWEEYYKLRDIPVKTPRIISDWGLSPFEDFAEAYKNTFTGIQVKTHYGILASMFPSRSKQTLDSGPCMNTYFDLLINNTGLRSDDEVLNDPKLQKCRQENASHYVSIVDDKTKQFVRDLMVRINK